MLGALALPAMAVDGAGTSADPFVVGLGANECTREASYGTMYFSFTPEESAVYTIKGVTNTFSSVKCDGEPAPYVNDQKYYSDPNTFYMMLEGGKTYTFESAYLSTNTLKIYLYKDSTQGYNLGTDCENPIEFTETGKYYFIPATGDYSTPGTVYMKYTPEDTKRVVVYAKAAIYASSYNGTGFCYGFEACDDSTATLMGTGSSTDDGYPLKVGTVDADETLYMKYTAQDGILMQVMAYDIVPGASCDDAWEIDGDSIEIPAEAGTYWYKYTLDSSYDRAIVTVTSDADASMTVQSSCDQTYGFEDYDTVGARMKLSNGSFRIFKIVKETASAAAETLSVKVSGLEDFDASDTAPIIETGTTSTPDFGGQYYYKVKSPATGSYFLDVKCLDEDVTKAKFTVAAADAAYGQYQSGYTSVRYECQPDTEYLITVELPITVLGIDFEVEFVEVEAGQAVTNPREAKLGENELPGWTTVWYTYTATEDCWLTIKADATAAFRAYKADQTSYEVTAVGENEWKMQVVAGDSYFLNFYNVSADTTMTLANVEFAEGDSPSKPVIVEGDSYTFDAAGTVWVKYVADDDMFLTLSTTLAYDNTTISIYKGSPDAASESFPTSGSFWSGYTFGTYKTSLANGESIYLKVKLTSAPAADKDSISFESAPVGPGEAPSKAIEITLPALGETEDFTLNGLTATYSGTKAQNFYTFTTTDPIILTISAASGYPTYNVRSESQMSNTTDSNYLATSNRDSETGVTTLKVALPTPAKYYLVYNGDTTGADMTVSITAAAPGEGEAAETATLIAYTYGEAFDYDLTPFKSSESSLNKWYAIDLNEGSFIIKGAQNQSFRGTLYAEDDYTKAIGEYTMDYSDYSASYTAEIPAAGRYYYALQPSYSGTAVTVNISGTALDEAIQEVGTGTEDDPFVLHVGENGPFTGIRWDSLFFKYVAKEEGVFTVAGFPGSLSEISAPYALSVNYNPTSYTADIYVKEGDEVTWRMYCFNEEAFSLAASFSAQEWNSGTDCEDPIVVEKTDEPVDFLCSSTETPVYGKFVNNQDTEVRVYMYMAYSLYGSEEIAYAESACDPEAYTSVKSSWSMSDYGNYRVSLGTLEPGETVYVRLKFDNSQTFTFVTEEIVPGASCLDAWTLEEGDNVLPAAAGTYWYMYTATDKEVATVTSDAAATVDVQLTCTAIATSYDKVAVREVISAGSTRYFIVNKAEATAADETIKLEVSAPEDYDSADTAYEIEAGLTSTPAYAGIYYYMVKTGDDSTFIDVQTATEGVEGVAYKFYAASNPSTVLAQDTDSARVEAAAETEYVVSVQVPVNVYGVDFEISFAEVEEGSVKSKPFAAVLGENDMPAWPSVWYTYTAEKTSWLVIKSDVAATVAVEAASTGTAASVTELGENEWRFRAVAGTEYLINMKNVTVAGTMTLETVDFAPGEDSSNPIDLTGDEYVVEETGAVWLKYTADEDGMLTVKTDLTYAFYANSVWYYKGSVASGAINPGYEAIPGSRDYKFKDYSAEMTAGEAFYIYISVSNEASIGSTFTFSMKGIEPGTTVGTAIEIELPAMGEDKDVEIMDGTSTSQPGYYWFEVTEEELPMELVVSVPVGNTLFEIRNEEQIKNMANVNDFTAQSITKWSQDGAQTLLRAALSIPGKYYFIVKGTPDSDFLDVNFAVTEPSEGVLPQTAIWIYHETETDNFDYTMILNKFTENKMNKWYAIRLNPGTFHMESDDWFTGALYSEDDFTTPIAKTVQDRYMNETLDAVIEHEGVYYYCAQPTTMMNAEVVVNFSGTAILGTSGIRPVMIDGVEMSVNNGVFTFAGEGEAYVYDLDGRVIAVVPAGESVELVKGVYVVAAGKNATKIVVK